MKKNILFVCNYFAPENTIAAVRTTKLVKYFRINGFHVDVITEKKKGSVIDETLAEDAEGIRVYYAENSAGMKRLYRVYQKVIKPYKNKRMKNLDNRERVNPKTGNVEFYPFETAYPIIGSLDYIFNQFRQKNLAKEAEKVLGKLKEYDFIITSYGDSFSYFFGKQYKKKHKKIKWVFDIRDAVCRYKFTPDYVKWIPLNYEKNIWRNADAIVGVSKGVCKRVPAKYRYKVRYIPNGYDETDKAVFIERTSSKMCFAYTGSMYGGLQNLSAFFVALKELMEEKLIEEEGIEVCYAGNFSAYEILKRQAGKSNLEDICIYYGRLTRKESMGLQQRSDLLLMASYDYKNNNGGVITGKLLEYMAANKPVVAIVTGDIENSEVSQIIQKTNIGFCYEESNKAKDFIQLKNYIYRQYKNWKEVGQTAYQPLDGEKKKFRYSNLTKKYIRLINELEEVSV